MSTSFQLGRRLPTSTDSAEDAAIDGRGAGADGFSRSNKPPCRSSSRGLETWLRRQDDGRRKRAVTGVGRNGACPWPVLHDATHALQSAANLALGRQGQGAAIKHGPAFSFFVRSLQS